MFWKDSSKNYSYISSVRLGENSVKFRINDEFLAIKPSDPVTVML